MTKRLGQYIPQLKPGDVFIAGRSWRSNRLLGMVIDIRNSDPMDYYPHNVPHYVIFQECETCWIETKFFCDYIDGKELITSRNDIERVQKAYKEYQLVKIIEK